MKTIVLLISVLLMMVVFAGCSTSDEVNSSKNTQPEEGSSSTDKEEGKNDKAEDVKVFRFGLNNPESHPLAQGVIKFSEILEEKSNGALKADFYFGGQLGDKKTQLQSIRTGALDMYMIMGGNLVDYGADALKILSLPYLFDNVEHARAVEKSEIGEELLSSIQESGTKMVGVGLYQESARNFFFKDNPATTVDELDGLKIRVQTSQLNIKLMDSFGVAATPVAFGELYSALQTGVVDGAEQPYSGYYSNKFHEIAKYYVLDGHEISPNIVLFSEIIWKTLSEEEQTMIKEAFNESIPHFEELSAKNDAEIIGKLKAEGVEILEFKEKDKLKELAQPLYSEFGEGYEEIIKDIQEFEY